MRIHFNDGSILRITANGYLDIKDRIMIIYEGFARDEEKVPIATVNMNMVKYIEQMSQFLVEEKG